MVGIIKEKDLIIELPAIVESSGISTTADGGLSNASVPEDEK